MKLKSLIRNNWQIVLKEEFEKNYFKNLEKFVLDEYQNYEIYPKFENIFKALELTDYLDVKVVIIGQDPYHNPEEAHGLAFSSKLKRYPASLRNIYRELESDLDIKRETGDLSDWANQGVLLLNTILTVRKNQPNSHKNCGWLDFTNQIIKVLNDREEPIVFVLWGDNAIRKKDFITNKHHHVLTSPHPSPLAAYRGFFGNKHFSKINQILKNNNQEIIRW